MKPTHFIFSSMLTSIAAMTSQNLLAETNETTIEETEILGTYKKNNFNDKEQQSLNVVDTLDSEAIARFGDSSAGDAIKRVVGVSLVDSKYAVIRGLKGRFVANRLNGASMPSLNPTRREIALDIFPSSILGGIEVEKSYRPELPGNTTGGMINMVTKDPTGDPTNQIKIGLGYTTGVTGKDVISYQGSKTDFLGYDSGMRKLPNNIDNATDFGSTGTTDEVQYLGGSFKNIYDLETRKATPDMDISYAYGDSYELGDGNLYLYGATSYQSSWNNRQDAVIQEIDKAGDYKRSTYNADLSFYLANAYEDSDANNRIDSKTLYLHQASDTTRLENITDLSEDTTDENFIYQWTENTYLAQQFSGQHGFLDSKHQVNWQLGIGHTTRYEPDRRQFSFRGGVADIFSVERRFGEMTELTYDLDVNYTGEFNPADFLTSTLKTGVYIQQKDRDARLARFAFNENDAQRGGKSFEEIFDTNNFEDEKVTTNVKTARSDNYEAEESITALYLSTENTLFDDLDVTLGVRMEDYALDMTYVANAKADSNSEESHVLPALNLGYHVNDEWKIKGGVSQTVSRPGITERATAQFYDPETDDRFVGNSELVSSDILNLDIRAEYFYDDKNNVSVALFHKTIDQPIEVTQNQNSGNIEEYTFANQDSASINGIEIDFAAGLFETDDFIIFTQGNLTLIDAKVTLTTESMLNESGNESERQFQGQSDKLANLQLGFEHINSHQTISLSSNYFSDRIYGIGSNRGDKIENGRFMLNAVYQWDASDSLSFNAKANNLLNTKTEYSIDDQVVESYKQGMAFKVGATFNF
ncbi:MAG: TonB-dependent receptor [Cellvibrionales bacterium]|nr:TonB-dependent receptor [Cellvibrionales bacterium]